MLNRYPLAPSSLRTWVQLGWYFGVVGCSARRLLSPLPCRPARHLVTHVRAGAPLEVRLSWRGAAADEATQQSFCPTHCEFRPPPQRSLEVPQTNRVPLPPWRATDAFWSNNEQVPLNKTNRKEYVIPTRKSNNFYRFKKVATPSLLRQKPDPGTNKNLKMGKMNPVVGGTSKSVIMAGGKKRPMEKDKSKSSQFKGASPAGSCNGSRVQDTPDFTVLDVKQEEFEQVEKTNIAKEWEKKFVLTSSYRWEMKSKKLRETRWQWHWTEENLKALDRWGPEVII